MSGYFSRLIQHTGLRLVSQEVAGSAIAGISSRRVGAPVHNMYHPVDETAVREAARPQRSSAPVPVGGPEAAYQLVAEFGKASPYAGGKNRVKDLPEAPTGHRDLEKRIYAPAEVNLHSVRSSRIQAIAAPTKTADIGGTLNPDSQVQALAHHDEVSRAERAAVVAREAGEDGRHKSVRRIDSSFTRTDDTAGGGREGQELHPMAVPIENQAEEVSPSGRVQLRLSEIREWITETLPLSAKAPLDANDAAIGTQKGVLSPALTGKSDSSEATCGYGEFRETSEAQDFNLSIGSITLVVEEPGHQPPKMISRATNPNEKLLRQISNTRLRRNYVRVR